MQDSFGVASCLDWNRNLNYIQQSNLLKLCQNESSTNYKIEFCKQNMNDYNKRELSSKLSCPNMLYVSQSQTNLKCDNNNSTEKLIAVSSPIKCFKSNNICKKCKQLNCTCVQKHSSLCGCTICCDDKIKLKTPVTLWSGRLDKYSTREAKKKFLNDPLIPALRINDKSRSHQTSERKTSLVSESDRFSNDNKNYNSNKIKSLVSSNTYDTPESKPTSVRFKSEDKIGSTSIRMDSNCNDNDDRKTLETETAPRELLSNTNRADSSRHESSYRTDSSRRVSSQRADSTRDKTSHRADSDRRLNIIVNKINTYEEGKNKKWIKIESDNEDACNSSVSSYTESCSEYEEAKFKEIIDRHSSDESISCKRSLLEKLCNYYKELCDSERKREKTKRKLKDIEHLVCKVWCKKYDKNEDNNRHRNSSNDSSKKHLNEILKKLENLRPSDSEVYDSGVYLNKSRKKERKRRKDKNSINCKCETLKLCKIICHKCQKNLIEIINS